MPRSYPNSHVAHGKQVGYSLTKRDGEPCYFIYFRGKDGRRLERDTQQTAVQRARETAHAIIEEEFAPVNIVAKVIGWDEASSMMCDKALADGRRSPTIEYYKKLIRRIRQFYADARGPADVSAEMAEAWKKKFSITQTRRKKLPSPHTVVSVIQGFSSLWQTWFVDELGICTVNPWDKVTAPKTDKAEVRVIEDETLGHFLGWLNERYSGWELPRLFIETKAVTGCRLMDLCTLESGQLRDGRLLFRAEQTKGRKGRSVLLPPELFARLDAIKGEKYVWQSYPEGIKEAVRKMGCPVHRIKSDFVPSRLYHWIETLFIDYGEHFPERQAIHSHMLRKRAFTAAWESGIDPRKAAIAIGCNPDTVMKHYVRLDEQAVTDEVMEQLVGRLGCPKMAEK